MELKEIPGFNGCYGITVDGQVWSYISKRFLKLTISSNGYYRMSLCKNGIWKGYSVHRLILATWGDLDLNDTQTVIHHLNGDPLDNRLDNLQIMSDHKHRCSHNKGYGINTKTHKLCTKCEKLKLRSEFNVNRRKPDELCCWCKSCKNESGQKYYQKLKEVIK